MTFTVVGPAGGAQGDTPSRHLSRACDTPPRHLGPDPALLGVMGPGCAHHPLVQHRAPGCIGILTPHAPPPPGDRLSLPAPSGKRLQGSPGSRAGCSLSCHADVGILACTGSRKCFQDDLLGRCQLGQFLAGTGWTRCRRHPLDPQPSPRTWRGPSRATLGQPSARGSHAAKLPPSLGPTTALLQGTGTPSLRATDLGAHRDGPHTQWGTAHGVQPMGYSQQSQPQGPGAAPASSWKRNTQWLQPIREHHPGPQLV